MGDLETIDDDSAIRATLLDLFTEIAILEHLVRLRLEPKTAGQLSAAQFGVLNYFSRLGKSEETVSALAWLFQVETDAMAKTVAALAERGMVTLDAAANPCVRITEAGRSIHRKSIEAMKPELLDILAEIPLGDLKTTARTLTEMRRTLDNLPDR